MNVNLSLSLSLRTNRLGSMLVDCRSNIDAVMVMMMMVMMMMMMISQSGCWMEVYSGKLVQFLSN